MHASMLTGLLLLAAGAPQEATLQEAPAQTPLTRALDTVTAAEIRSDLMFLASDAMAGRDSPSPELRVAARFIRARLMRLGFEPAAPGGKYLHEWKIHQVGLDADATGATLSGPNGSASLDFRDDYYYASWGSLGMRDVTGEIVSGGDLTKETLESLEVKGRWVLDAGLGRGISRRRTRDLEERGALGVLVLPRAGSEKSVAELLERTNRQFGRKRLSWKGGSDEARFPLVHITEDAARSSGIAAAAEGLGAGDVLDGWSLSERCAFGDLGEVTLENVVGLWPGSDPELSKEVIILSAHYDHVGVDGEGNVFNGADDNGSGTTGMLAIAEALEAYGPMRRSVMLMWVSAEEKGLLGSEAWTKDPYMPEGRTPLCNINIDMIGRNAPDEFLITPTKDHEAYSALTQVAEANAASEGFTKIKSADAYWERSDQFNFRKHMGLPVAFLFCDVHEDYHKTTDTPDKIDYDKMRRIVRLVVRMLEALQIDSPKF